MSTNISEMSIQRNLSHESIIKQSSVLDHASFEDLFGFSVNHTQALGFYSPNDDDDEYEFKISKPVTYRVVEISKPLEVHLCRHGDELPLSRPFVDRASELLVESYVRAHDFLLHRSLREVLSEGIVSDVLSPRCVSEWIPDLTRECVEPNPGPQRRTRKNGNGNGRKVRKRNLALERPGLIMPPRHVASLMFIDGAYVRNNPGNNYLVYSFRINDLYDPDPLILSGSVSGFKELMSFYQYYRVLSFSATVNISNNEAFDIFYGAVFSQSNLTGTIASRDDAANALENNYAKGPFILSEKTGMDRGSMTLRIRPSSLLGVPKQYFADNNYVGTGLATPPIPLWLNFIVYTPTGAALTNGYTSATKLFFTAEFFGRLNLRA